MTEMSGKMKKEEQRYTMLKKHAEERILRWETDAAQSISLQELEQNICLQSFISIEQVLLTIILLQLIECQSTVIRSTVVWNSRFS